MRAILTRIGALEGGTAQIARMAEIEDISRRPAPVRATLGMAVVCVFVHVVGVFTGSDLQSAGYFNGGLVADGDLWRVVTAMPTGPFGPFNMKKLGYSGIEIER